jgi:PIN domain nuclease of toxin-antitoxin system
MRLLFDTHIFLWAVANDPKLSARARSLITAADEVFVSSASIWEVAIKAGKGKLDVDVDRLVDKINTSEYRELPVRMAHGAAVRHLPHYISIRSTGCSSHRHGTNRCCLLPRTAFFRSMVLPGF